MVGREKPKWPNKSGRWIIEYPIHNLSWSMRIMSDPLGNPHWLPMKSTMKFPMKSPWNPQVSLGFPACCLEDFWCTQYIPMGTDIGIYSHQPTWRYSIYRDINRYYMMYNYWFINIYQEKNNATWMYNQTNQLNIWSTRINFAPDLIYPKNPVLRRLCEIGRHPRPWVKMDGTS